MTYYTYLLIIYIAYLFLFSIISVLLFFKDKSLAKNNQIRIKERTLLTSSVLGGGFGALIGRILAHHKTDKIYFSIIIYLSVLFEILILVFLIFVMNGGLN